MLQLLPIAYLLTVTPSLCYWDLKEQRLPNRFTFSAIAVSFLAVLLSFDVRKIAIASSVAILTVVIGLALNSFSALGMGDVKLVAAMALALGYFDAGYFLFALAIGLGAAAIVSVILLVRKQLTRNSSIPLGPYLLLGFALSSSLVFREFITVAV